MPPALTARFRREWLLFLVLGLAVVALAAWTVGLRAGESAVAAAGAQGAAAARLKVAVLRAEIEKHRSMPHVLAQDPDVAVVLNSAGEPAMIEAMNRKLEALSRDTRVGVIYLLNGAGRAIAASNWQTPTSFVGQDYAFRPYFIDAMKAGGTEHFAMGTISRRPGLYLARRIGTGLGVVVIKVEFDALEADWAEDKAPVIVSDDRGVILLTDRPDWRFRTLIPVPEAERASLRTSLQFGDAPLDLLPVGRAGDGDRVRIGQDAYLESTLPVPTTGWTLHLFTALQPALGRAEANGGAIAALALLVATVPAGLLLRRRHRGLGRLALDEATRIELERQVAARTRDLVTVNRRLSAEMEERRLLEARRQQLHDELIQANRLTILGQISASVAHEINQPLAAIRAYADNAGVFLDRGDGDGARENLGLIAKLTDRVGSITGQLRNFSRRAPKGQDLTSVAGAIDGALLMIGHRLRQKDARIDKTLPADDIKVKGDPVRLEQVLVNLLQNAIDALADRPQALIAIAVAAEGDQVVITVADNGPGLSAGALETLFTPFVTSKPAGLGLGLVISNDIVKDLGGTMTVANRPEGGAIFTVRLNQA